MTNSNGKSLNRSLIALVLQLQWGHRSEKEAGKITRRTRSTETTSTNEENSIQYLENKAKRKACVWESKEKNR